MLESVTEDACLVLQVLPLLKAFFVLCEARTAHLPSPAGSAAARRTASLDMSRGVSMDVPELVSQPSAALSLASEKAAAEAHLPFLRYVQAHQQCPTLSCQRRDEPGWRPRKVRQGLMMLLSCNGGGQQVGTTSSQGEGRQSWRRGWSSCPAESAAVSSRLGLRAAGLRSGTGGCST